MIAREWKAKCPTIHEEGFIAYLYETGVKDTAKTDGFLGAQIFNRDSSEGVEITLITYWTDVESIKTFAGEDIGVAKLYPEDDKYELQPDHYVTHYNVRENTWVNAD